MGPVGTDPRWEAFGPFHSYLNSAFPNVYVRVPLTLEATQSISALRHSTLALTKVNTYGLVYEWTGTNSTSKPILLTAHQGKPTTFVLAVRSMFMFVVDVVPVNPDTLSEWTHPPYSGHFDGQCPFLLTHTCCTLANLHT